MVKKEEHDGKNLYIELDVDMNKLLAEYEQAAGIPSANSAFAMGYLSGIGKNEPIALSQLQYILQIYFFAGVRYGKEFKFKYEYVTPEERDILNKDRLERNKTKVSLSEQNSNPKMDYVG